MIMIKHNEENRYYEVYETGYKNMEIGTILIRDRNRMMTFARKVMIYYNSESEPVYIEGHRVTKGTSPQTCIFATCISMRDRIALMDCTGDVIATIDEDAPIRFIEREE